MERGSYSYRLKSHPERLLIDHLLESAKTAEGLISSLSFNLGLDKKVLAKVAYIIGFTHDLGKATTYFQIYINASDLKEKESLKNDPKTHHSLLSALFTYHLTKRFLVDEGLLDDDGYYQYLPIFSFMAVRRHHGNLDNLYDEILQCLENDLINLLKEQLASLDEEFERILSILERPKVNLDPNAILQELRRDEKRRIKSLNKLKDIRPYLLFQLLYSSLLNADKKDAIGVNIQDRININSNLIDHYKEIKFRDTPTSKINAVREEIYSKVIKKVLHVDLKRRVYSINVPTGLGKTLTSISFALRLRKRIACEKGFVPRIIYCLPFLSIIDQNYSVIEDAFLKLIGKRPGSSLLLKHHHLSEVTYYGNQGEYSQEESLFLIEGWSSEIIVTTFIQLFHSLISNQNRMIRKFPQIVNSIIILDEVQSIPYQYWHLVRRLFLEFASIFDTYFIFITATKPLIFEEDEIEELIEGRSSYFNILDRVELISRLENPILLDEFKSIVFDDITSFKEDSFLVVLNTINSSLQIYKFLESLKEEGALVDTNLYYLSTNIIPKHRLMRLEEIKKDKSRKIIVSTQLVEAGVDLDVDRVFRDFGPLDSINQVAGRCNRNSSKDKKGIVKVFILKDERKEFYKYIYRANDLALFKTRRLLKEGDELSEKDFLELIENYYRNLGQAKSDDEVKRLVELLERMDVKTASSRFKLIEEGYPTKDLFIEIDAEAKEVWQRFLEIGGIKDAFTRRSEFLKIKKVFCDHCISVASNRVAENEFEDTGIIHISYAQIEGSYDESTGYKREQEAIAII
ncbi:CRISPR-associated helicase Cas3' [candidate division NPL-UPA2 bacterium]|nr:CRISPR-associated helicase Cas3' [candidate division NPL-UPA2 bacterium]